jgi:hypothetical protein
MAEKIKLNGESATRRHRSKANSKDYAALPSVSYRIDGEFRHGRPYRHRSQKTDEAAQMPILISR